MGQQFSNAARSELATGISAGDTTITLVDGSRFPEANAGTAPVSNANLWFKAVLQDETGFEIVYVRTHVVATTPNTLSNVIRGQEGTTARSFAVNSVVGIRPLASDMADALNDRPAFNNINAPATSATPSWVMRKADGSEGAEGRVAGAENNLAIGTYAHQYLDSSATGNTAIGSESQQDITTGKFNASLGAAALIHLTTGHRNTAVGADAGNIITTGSNNTFIGCGAGPYADDSSNEIVIGAFATGNGSNTTTIGNWDNVANYLKGQTFLEHQGVLDATPAHTPTVGLTTNITIANETANYVASAIAAHFKASNESTSAGATGASGEVGYSRAVYAEAEHNSNYFVNDIYGMTAVANTSAPSTGNLKYAYGIHGGTFHYGEGQIETVFNNFSETYHAGSGHILEAIAYYGDASRESSGEIVKHTTLANKDLSSHVNAQYGAVLWGNSRLGNNWAAPTHTLEVAGVLDIEDNNAVSPVVPGGINFGGQPFITFDSVTYEIKLNPIAAFDLKINYLKSNSLTIAGDYGGYILPNFAPSGAGLVPVTSGGDGTLMGWYNLSDKANASHTHGTSDVTGLNAVLATFAPNGVTLTDQAGTATLPALAVESIASRLQVLRNNVKQVFADLAGKADDSTVVKLTGAQTVAGVKTLTDRSAHAGAYTPSAQPAHSATPNFDCATSNVFEPAPLTGNVNMIFLSNAVAGQTVQIRFQQDATGGRTVAVPSTAKVDGSINTAANRVSWLILTYSARASRWEGNWLRVPA